jgi:glycosyltransferase involved in cell wall biosynthesis
VLLIRSLDIGGAERQLVELAKGLHRRGVAVRVLTFYRGGALRPELEAEGVAVQHLGKRSRWHVLRFLYRLVWTLRAYRPDALYSFLPVANILATVVRPLVDRRMRVVWGIRASNMDLSHYDWTFRLVARFERFFARCADAIVVNSRAGRDYHVALGFPAERMCVIPNGIDIERFRFDAEGRRRVRSEWGVADDELLIGLVARLDPIKGHETFLQAAARFVREVPRARFACVGDGPPAYRDHLQALAAELGLSDRVILVGARSDMPAVYSAFDMATSSSYGEGFSNAIAEAMACERPCVVTDVGDSRLIVGECGAVVRTGDPIALAQGMAEVHRRLFNERDLLTGMARVRISTLFSQSSMLDSSLLLLRRFGSAESAAPAAE